MLKDEAMPNPYVRAARRFGGASLLLLAGALVAFPSVAVTPKRQYGPPYVGDSSNGSQSFATVNEAVQFVIDG
ncbi:hypothetical protein, partial [Xanthomonas graminis]